MGPRAWGAIGHLHPTQPPSVPLDRRDGFPAKLPHCELLAIVWWGASSSSSGSPSAFAILFFLGL